MKRFWLEYSDCTVREQIVAYIRENWEELGYDEKPSENEAFDDSYSECYYDWFDEAWEDFCEMLGGEYKKRYKNGCAKVEGFNLDWCGRSGYKYIYVSTKFETFDAGAVVIEQIAPNCEISISVGLDKGRLKITVYHHDCPMGSTFLFKPCAESTYKRNA